MSKIFNPESHQRLNSDERRKLIPPEKILNLMNIRNGDILLDAGAGKGYFAIPAIDFVGAGGKVIAADISQQMIDLLIHESLDSKRPHTLLCATDKIPLPENSVDKILMAFVLHEVDDAVTYLKMLRRILKDNGKLFIVEWEKTDSPMGPPLHDRLGKNELKDILLSSGFIITRLELINEMQYFCEVDKMKKSKEE
jgi:ubiquinone/menaquinone biosynthesis C-methylase UbiE